MLRELPRPQRRAIEMLLLRRPSVPLQDVARKRRMELDSVSEEIEELSVSQKIAQLLSAHKGDIVYVSDARRWLGGLRSVHARISAIHEEDPLEVWITPALAKQGNLVVDRKHRIEKII